MANNKVFLFAVSMVGFFFILTWSSSSFLQFGHLKRRMLWVIPIAISVALHKLEIVSQFVGKLIARFSKPSVSMPKGLHARRQNQSSLSKPPAPWNLAILIVLYLIVAIFQAKVRTQFYLT